MARRPVSVPVKPKDLARIEEFLRCGVQQVRTVLRALALRGLARGATAPRVAEVLPLRAKAIRQIAHRYNSGGLDRALYDRQRPGAKPLLDDSQKQRIVAMVCGKPPEGRARWTVRLVAEEAVKRKLVPRAGRETIRVMLESHDLKPWGKKMWCVAELDRKYIERMEDVLAVYEKPHQADEPVLCLGEKPICVCQLDLFWQAPKAG